MQLYLIRHAESENNAKPESQRVEDPHITETGHEQADHLSRWLATLEIDTLITSPVRRALQTTRYVSRRSGQHVHVWANVFEEGGIYRGHGTGATRGGPGLSRTSVIEHVAGDSDNCTLDDSIVESGWWGERDRETPEQAIARAALVAERLVDTFGSSGQCVVAIIHADFKRKLLGQLIGGQIDPRSLGRLQNTGITKLSRENGAWQLDWFNSVSHLPAGLITGNDSG